MSKPVTLGNTKWTYEVNDENYTNNISYNLDRGNNSVVVIPDPEYGEQLWQSITLTPSNKIVKLLNIEVFQFPGLLGFT